MRNKIVICFLFIITCIFITGCDNNKQDNKFINSDSVIEKDNYILSDFYSEITTDTAFKKGWFYYYTTTNEDKAAFDKWEVTEYNNGFMAYVNIENNTKEEVKYLDNIKVKVIVNDKDEYEGKIFVNNIGQTDKDGLEIRSTMENPIKPGEKTKYSTLINIPNTLAESDDKMILVLNIFDDEYKVDLRQSNNMEIFKG